MKASEALEILTLVRLNWRLAVPADADDLDLLFWPHELADVDFDCAQLAVRRFGSASFAPTLLQIANVARAEAHFRSNTLALPEPDGITAEEWLATASEEDRQTLARVSSSLREKFGIDLIEEEQAT